MYTREDVELYLPAVWFDSYLSNPPRRPQKAPSIDPDQWRLLHTLPCKRFHAKCDDPDWCKTRVENATDPIHRKSASNPKKGNTALAEMIDVRDAWAKAPLTIDQRRALFLAFGLPPRQRWSQEEVGFNQGVSQQAISKRIDKGMEKIIARLNGGVWSELADIDI